MGQNKRGFTIIEVVLFLALSGLLFLVGFIGIGSRTQSVQATDSMRSLEGFVQQELNELVSGVNVQQVSPGEDSNTIVMGKLFYILGNKIDVYTIIGNRLSGDQLALDSNSSEIDLIDAAEPRAYLGGTVAKPYDVRWGSTFVSSYNQTAPSNYSVFGFLRSPGSTEIYPIALEAGGLDLSGNLLDSATYSVGNDVDLQLCYELPNNQVAALQIAPGSQKESVQVLFEGSLC